MVRMKTRQWSTALATCAAVALLNIASAADSKDPIKIPLHNWSSQIVGAYIVGKLLNGQGYDTQYLPADSQEVYTSMCNGDIDVVHEIWEGAHAGPFEKAVAEGCAIDAATHDAETREEWWYPKYAEESCPGLPDWEALNACAEKFATPETAPKGRFVAGPIGWAKHDKERVEALGMDFEVVNVDSADAIWAELATASKSSAPVVLFNWTPNFIEAVYEGSFVEFPAYEEGCREDPAWGSNPDMTHDCGDPKGGYLKVGVWKGVPDKWPGAYAVLQKINFSNHDVAVMAKFVDTDGMKPEAAADMWLSDNETKVAAWTN